MKKSLKKYAFVGLAATSFLLSGCGSSHTKVESETLYVSKVDNIKDDFVMAMDASAVISLEQSGVKYFNFEGNEEDVFKILADNGINYIRVRVWNDPFDESGHGYGGGNCTIDTAVAIGKRATKYGMKLLLDFHYSDFWADPGRQSVPKAWKGMDIEDKSAALYDYTKESLELLKENNVDVGIVQVGNETNDGRMCGEKTWYNSAFMLMNAGSKAIREVFPKAKVALHFTNPEKADNIMYYAGKIDYYEVDYDIFGVSYYPYWHGTLDNLANTLNQVSDTYNKDVMVLETSYPYNSLDGDFNRNVISIDGGFPKDYVFSVAGQANHVRNLTDTMVNKVKRGVGISYWEGTWIPVGTTSWEENNAKWDQYGSGWANVYASSYDKEAPTESNGGCTWENQAFFDWLGHPLESLKVFNLVRSGNVDVPLYIDGVESIEDICYADEKDYQLPTEVNVIFNSNERVAKPVTWNLKTVSGYDYVKNGDFTIAKIQALGNADYVIKGIVEGLETELKLQVIKYNYVQNFSFENGKTITPWQLNMYGATPSGSYLCGVKDENPKTGTYAFHTWTNSKDTCKFELTQDLNLTKSGTYKYQFSILGGTGSQIAAADKQNIYGFIMINGVAIDDYKIDVTVTKYDDGYKTWAFSGIEYNAGDTVTLGIHVEEREAEFWCCIDDVMFNLIKE